MPQELRIKLPHARQVLDMLESLYGNEAKDSARFCYDEPLDDLILTVLSQNTNDKLRDKAFANMRQKYPTWEDVLSAPLDNLKETIRIAGMTSRKPANIQAILKQILADFGCLSIKQMRAWEHAKARNYLINLPGVGVKTVAVVECFDLQMPAFPVDTHISRIAKHLGWARANESPDKIQARIEKQLMSLSDRFLGGHLNFLCHGRGICNARTPRCGDCPLAKICVTGKNKERKKCDKENSHQSQKTKSQLH